MNHYNVEFWEGGKDTMSDPLGQQHSFEDAVEIAIDSFSWELGDIVTIFEVETELRKHYKLEGVVVKRLELKATEVDHSENEKDR